MSNRGPVDLLAKLPTHIRLRLDGAKVLARASTGAASAIRKRWGNSRGAQGPFPEADHYAGYREPMQRTGEMRKNIKGYWGKKRGGVTFGRSGTSGTNLVRWVGPNGTYPDGKRMAMVYFVQVHTRPELKHTLPLGWDEDVAKKSAERANTDIKRQLKSGNAGLAFELRKIR